MVDQRNAIEDGKLTSAVELSALRDELRGLRDHIRAFGAEMEPLVTAASPRQTAAARNLVDYLGLRQMDLRELQDQLARVGLSSLGRSEGHVMPALDAVLGILDRLLADSEDQAAALSTPDGSLAAGERDLAEQATELLGPEPRGRQTRIMVTLDGATLEQPALIRTLIKSGMNCARINCAHDDADTWTRLATEVRQAARELGRECLVDMDLPGPKLRTGPLAPSPGVARWRVRRGPLGDALGPASIWLTPEETPEPAPDRTQVSLPLPKAWLDHVRPGDTLVVRDTRDRKRRLSILERVGRSRVAQSDQGAYVVAGARVSHNRSGHRVQRPTQVGSLPEQVEPLVLKPGDYLEVTPPDQLGGTGELDAEGLLLRRPHIGCTEPVVFGSVREGQAIWFDDGKLGGVVESASSDGLLVRMVQTDPDGTKLRADKGINLPDSELPLPALGDQDLEDLDVVAAHADMVALSFVNRPEDIAALRSALAQRTDRPIGIVLKIETRTGFRNLPRLLLEALQSRPVGVMIARGDLAVECGYERLAEVQEEMLWLCEAAHVPVIWATQVLEQLAKAGRPSRAEITDAAMGVRAECVMLNKGEHTVAAVRALDNILSRMQMHQRKKRSLFRRLNVSFVTLNDDDEEEDAESAGEGSVRAALQG
jgi:pyruvate kinase